MITESYRNHTARSGAGRAAGSGLGSRALIVGYETGEKPQVGIEPTTAYVDRDSIPAPRPGNPRPSMLWTGERTVQTLLRASAIIPQSYRAPVPREASERHLSTCPESMLPPPPRPPRTAVAAPAEEPWWWSGTSSSAATVTLTLDLRSSL